VNALAEAVIEKDKQSVYRDAVLMRSAQHADKDGFKKALEPFREKKTGNLLDFANKLGVKVVR